MGGEIEINTLSNKQEARDIYTSMCKERAISTCPEVDRILHLQEFYRYMLHPDWDLLGKTKVEDSYLFHIVRVAYRDPSTEYAGPDKVFVLMPRGR